jgi:L-ascorbate metabolism protein UlaG (beta-lactamase superfamily)
MPGERVRLGPVTVTVTEAAHVGLPPPLSGTSRSLGFVLEGSRRVYFAGDTDLFPGMASLAPLDVALLPVWGWGPRLGTGHLDPERAAVAAALMQPRLCLPIHWGTFYPVGMSRVRRHLLTEPPREFARHAATLAPTVAVRVLPAGGSIDLPPVRSS